MKKAILVAHGSGGPSFSIPQVKTITKAKEGLPFTDAINYMKSNNSWPEYASTGFGSFSPLSDADCQKLFNNKVPAGAGIVDTGLRRDGDLNGPVIYALRVHNLDKDGLTNFINTNSITSLMLLACRAQ